MAGESVSPRTFAGSPASSRRACAAARMKLTGRGTLTEGSYADVLVFDAKKFRDHATFTDSAKPADGLDYMFINGELTVEDGKWVPGAYNGKCILADE